MNVVTFYDYSFWVLLRWELSPKLVGFTISCGGGAATAKFAFFSTIFFDEEHISLFQIFPCSVRARPRFSLWRPQSVVVAVSWSPHLPTFRFWAEGSKPKVGTHLLPSFTQEWSYFLFYTKRRERTSAPSCDQRSFGRTDARKDK